MFIPEQSKANFAELLGDEKTLRKLKKTAASTNGKPTVFGGIGDIPSGGERCGDAGCDTRYALSFFMSHVSQTR